VIKTNKVPMLGTSLRSNQSQFKAKCRKAGLTMIPFPDRDQTRFCNSEQERIGLDFKKNLTGSDMDIQTPLITAVKCLIRSFFRI